jgi:hypothetical protein
MSTTLPITENTVTTGIMIGANTPAALARLFDVDPAAYAILAGVVDDMARRGLLLIEPNDVHTLHCVTPGAV